MAVSGWTLWLTGAAAIKSSRNTTVDRRVNCSWRGWCGWCGWCGWWSGGWQSDSHCTTHPPLFSLHHLPLPSTLFFLLLQQGFGFVLPFWPSGCYNLVIRFAQSIFPERGEKRSCCCPCSLHKRILQYSCAGNTSNTSSSSSNNIIIKQQHYQRQTTNRFPVAGRTGSAFCCLFTIPLEIPTWHYFLPIINNKLTNFCPKN